MKIITSLLTLCNSTLTAVVYCLRRKPGQELKWIPLWSTTTINYEFWKLDNGTVRATRETKRNDSRLSSHNRIMLQHQRGNVDLQIIVDVQPDIWPSTQQKVNADPSLCSHFTNHVLSTFTATVMPKRCYELHFVLLAKEILVHKKLHACYLAYHSYIVFLNSSCKITNDN